MAQFSFTVTGQWLDLYAETGLDLDTPILIYADGGGTAIAINPTTPGNFAYGAEIKQGEQASAGGDGINRVWVRATSAGQAIIRVQSDGIISAVRKNATGSLISVLDSASSISILTGQRVLVVIDEDRRRTRDGELFTVSDRNSLAASATSDLLLRTGDKPVAMRFQITSAAELDIGLYEGSTVDIVGATQLTPRSRNRILAPITEPLIGFSSYRGVTTSVLGTPLLDVFVPAGLKNSTVGGAGNSDVPFGLKANTDYVFRKINRSNATNEISLIMTIFEDVQQ